jgi:hypothetical protein
MDLAALAGQVQLWNVEKVNVSSCGTSAWAVFWFGVGELDVLVKTTAVLSKIDGKWKIVHAHNCQGLELKRAQELYKPTP